MSELLCLQGKYRWNIFVENALICCWLTKRDRPSHPLSMAMVLTCSWNCSITPDYLVLIISWISQNMLILFLYVPLVNLLFSQMSRRKLIVSEGGKSIKMKDCHTIYMLLCKKFRLISIFACHSFTARWIWKFFNVVVFLPLEIRCMWLVHSEYGGVGNTSCRVRLPRVFEFLCQW